MAHHDHSNCKHGCIGLSQWSASQFGDLARIKKLVSIGNDVNKFDTGGYTALHYASQANKTAVVTYLLSNGAKIDISSCGATQLHRAAFNGHTAICEILLNAGADINAVDSSFGDLRTALHKASSNGHSDTVQLLLQRGADTAITDSQGRTAREVAESGGYNLVACLLLEHGREFPQAVQRQPTTVADQTPVVELLASSAAEEDVALVSVPVPMVPAGASSSTTPAAASPESAAVSTCQVGSPSPPPPPAAAAASPAARPPPVSVGGIACGGCGRMVVSMSRTRCCGCGARLLRCGRCVKEEKEKLLQLAKRPAAPVPPSPPAAASLDSAPPLPVGTSLAAAAVSGEGPDGRCELCGTGGGGVAVGGR